MRLDPLAIGLPPGEPLLDLLIRNNAFSFEIHQQHTARLQTALVADIRGFEWQNACFRGHDQQVVVRNEVSCGPQTVSVERCPDYTAIGECNGSGTIPWFHE